MPLIPQSCPSCSSPLVVTQLNCSSCGTGVVGKFELSPFHRVSPESLKFLEVFVHNRGNVKEMERDLGVSYWSIRNRLTEVVERLQLEALPASGAAPQDEDLDAARQAILAELAAGQIDASEAAQRLAALQEA